MKPRRKIAFILVWAYLGMVTLAIIAPVVIVKMIGSTTGEIDAVRTISDEIAPLITAVVGVLGFGGLVTTSSLKRKTSPETGLGLLVNPSRDDLRPCRLNLIPQHCEIAEGQVVWTCLSPTVTGRRLVSFLVSYMFVYLRTSRLYRTLSKQNGPMWPFLDGHPSC